MDGSTPTATEESDANEPVVETGEDTVETNRAVVECSSVTRTYERGGSGGWFSRGDGWFSFGRDDRSDHPTVTALSDVSLTIERGEFVGLSGPSGSGKSTLVHLLAGLDEPTEGTVTLAGKDVASLSSKELTRLRLEQVGIVFQRFHLLPSLSARANVALPLVERGVGKGERRERASVLLERVGLGDRQTHRPGELSGGEQQRVAVARALAGDPLVVFADEPTGELDTDTGTVILDLLGDLAEDRAVVLASHDEQALDRTDRVIRLRDGRVKDV